MDMFNRNDDKNVIYRKNNISLIYKIEALKVINIFVFKANVISSNPEYFLTFFSTIILILFHRNHKDNVGLHSVSMFTNIEMHCDFFVIYSEQNV